VQVIYLQQDICMAVINNLSIEESLAKGTELSSKVIQKIGARI
jgi:hypothetical protein